MLKNVFRKMCEIRYFEEGVIQACKEEQVRVPVYLSYGEEAIASTISELYPDAMIFPQHRGHSWYLAYGGSPEGLRDEVLSKVTGCSGGKGGSSDIQCKNMEAHHGFIGENVSIGTGYALGSGRLTIPVFGDGALEEDYVAVSIGFAATRKLPVLFVVEDNGLAILTKIEVRRSWDAIDMAKGYGVPAVGCDDDPIELIKIFEKKPPLPFLINVRTCRHKWHVGIGVDGEPEMDRLSLFRLAVPEASEIEKDAKARMEELWKR